MSTLNLFERTPFDLLVRNFLTTEANYRPVEQNLKLAHPLDVYQDTFGLTFEIACTGIDKSDLEILIEGQTLRVNYDKKQDVAEEVAEEETSREYLYKGIAKRSFEQKFRLEQYVDVKDATLSNGLLTISLIREVPEERKPREILLKAI